MQDDQPQGTTAEAPQEAAAAPAATETAKPEPQKHGGREQRGDRPPRPQGENRGDRREQRGPGEGRPFEGFADIDIEKLISDSLYLDNQAHAVVARMRDMDSGTKSQLRRL